MTFVHLDSVIKLVQIINEQNTHYVKGILHINSIPNRSIEITPGEDQEDLNCYKKENNERWELLDLLEKCTSYVMESYFQFWFKFDRSVFNLKWSKKINEKDNNKTKGDWWTKHKQKQKVFFLWEKHTGTTARHLIGLHSSCLHLRQEPTHKVKSMYAMHYVVTVSFKDRLAFEHANNVCHSDQYSHAGLRNFWLNSMS